MALTFSTAAVHPRDRLAYWRESVTVHFPKLELNSGVGPAFGAGARVHQLADLLVTETSSCQGRMQEMREGGRWQAMSPAEQAGITRQMTQGHMTLDEIGELAARANVKAVVLSHLTHKRDGDYTSWAEEVKKYFSGQVLVAKDLMEF